SSASLPAAPGLTGGGDGERPGSGAAAARRLLTLTKSNAEDALIPTGALAPDGTSAVSSASLRFQNARRLVALASGRLAQMAQTGALPESAPSVWSQSGQCLAIFFQSE